MSAALAALTEALDEPGTDIGQLLERLGEVVASTVTSFVALSIRTATTGAQIEFVAQAAGHDDLSGIRSSLLVPLSGHGAAGTDSGSQGSGSQASLILYAGQPGAFVDLAADIAWITGLDHDRLRLDEHLEPSADAATALALAEWSMRNQAVGTLVEHGFRPADARAAVARFSADPDELAEQVTALISDRDEQ